MRKPFKRGFSPFFTIGRDQPVVFEPPVDDLDDKLYERLAAEAEAGYEVDKLAERPRRRRRDMTRTYRVELWQQPLHHWLAAQIYHRYDTWIYRLPGFALLERIHRWRYRGDDKDMYVPLAACHDIRCYELSVKGRQVLAVFDVDEATYEQLGARKRPRSPTPQERS